MVVNFLFLVIVVVAVPVDLEKYDVHMMPNHVRKKAVDVFLLPRSLMLPKRHGTSLQLDVESFDEITETPNIDNFNKTGPEDRDKNKVDSVPDLNSWVSTYGGDDYNNEDTDNRIVGGVEVDINLYPYNVAYGTHCGGAIIGPKWVLTAGHCGSKGYIKFGSKYQNQGYRIGVAVNHVHPMWSEQPKEHPLDYDFQVLELEHELLYDENAQPVKVAHLQDMVIGRRVTVTGWGRTEEKGPYSNILRAVIVPIIGKNICQQVPFPYFRRGLTSRMFCAGYKEGEKDACQGDSGGPAVASDRLLGLVSFGYGCATPGSYGVYSKVAKVRDWIQSVTGLKLD